MKHFLIVFIAALLGACVSSPADLYGVHDVKPAPRNAQDARFAGASATHGDARQMGGH